MEAWTFKGAALLAFLTTSGCSSAVTNSNGNDNNGGQKGGTSESCDYPIAKLSLTLEAPGCPDNSLINQDPVLPAPIDGVFEPLTDGFHVIGTNGIVEAHGLVPPIPTGTFVHLSYTCSGNLYRSGPGTFVMLENLGSLDGKPNPTEQGERLWLLAAAGGPVSIPDTGRPFDFDFEIACGFEDKSSLSNMSVPVAVFNIKLTGPGCAVTALPAEETPFTVSSGPHAGSYHLKNIGVTTSGIDDGDINDTNNYTITRAD